MFRLVTLVLAAVLLTISTISCGNPRVSVVKRDTAAAPQKWYFYTLDSSVSMPKGNGNRTSQAIVNGNPAVAYRDYTTGDVRFVRATSANGTAWGTPQTVASSGGTGLYCSLATVNGNPAIAYWDSKAQQARFVRANNANGTGSWNLPVVLDSGTGDMNTRSLVVVNGNPAVCFGRTSASGITDLCYMRSIDINGTAWSPAVVLASASGSPDPTPNGGCLEVVNGNPAVTFRDWEGGYYRLSYIRAQDISGEAWGAPLVLDTDANTGHWASLHVVNGNPAVSYERNTYDGSPEGLPQLRYIRANDANGTAWGVPKILDTQGKTGVYSSLAVIGGVPAIAYCDLGLYRLRFIKARDANGSSWNKPSTPDAQNGDCISLLAVNANPGISYYARVGALKYAKYQ